MTKASISGFERNTTTPSLETVKSLAILYHSSVDYMVGFEDRTTMYIDDLSENQQQFMLDMLQQVRDRFIDNPKRGSTV